MCDKFHLKHIIELAQGADQIRDYHETLHVVSLVRLLEVSE